MKTLIVRPRQAVRFTRAAAFCLLALTAALLTSREARAQWSTPNAQGNINSTNTGNVGVGTATPTAKLTVSVTGSADGVAVDGAINPTFMLKTSGVVRGYLGAVTGADNYAVGSALGDIALRTQGGKLLFDTNSGAGTPSLTVAGANGNVGIGTTTPGAKFDVGAGAPARGSYSDMLIGPGGNTSQLEFYGPTKSSAITHDESFGGMLFYINGPSWAPAMIVANSGNVGIGTTAPASKLHVAGNITVDGNINAKYQDVAEWVPTTQKLAAGTVVVLDTKRGNHVNASTRAYDTRVAGVVSAQPGLTLGEAGEGKALVATTGRVKVKVDATRAPIEIGDLIVTSDVEGVAMKSVEVDLGGVKLHRPGTIVGKALEALDNGTGEILVLLSLQ